MKKQLKERVNKTRPEGQSWELLNLVGNDHLLTSVKVKKAYKALLLADGVFTNEPFGVSVAPLLYNEQGVVLVEKKDGVVTCVRYHLVEGEVYVDKNEREYKVDFGTEEGYLDDWKAVLLLGNSTGQPTLTKAYGNLQPKNYLATELRDRQLEDLAEKDANRKAEGQNKINKIDKTYNKHHQNRPLTREILDKFKGLR